MTKKNKKQKKIEFVPATPDNKENRALMNEIIENTAFKNSDFSPVDLNNRNIFSPSRPSTLSSFQEEDNDQSVMRKLFEERDSDEFNEFDEFLFPSFEEEKTDDEAKSSGDEKESGLKRTIDEVSQEDSSEEESEFTQSFYEQLWDDIQNSGTAVLAAVQNSDTTVLAGVAVAVVAIADIAVDCG